MDLNKEKDWEHNWKNNFIPWDIKRPDSYLQSVMSTLNVKEGNALDLGCGSGYDSRYLSDLGFNVTGIDISESAIKRAKSIHSDINFVVGDIETDIPKNNYQIIYDRGCLHNNYEIVDSLLTTIRKNLDGYFIMVVGGEEDSDYPRPEKFYIHDFIQRIENDFKIVLIKEINFDLAEGNGKFPGWLVILR